MTAAPLLLQAAGEGARGLPAAPPMEGPFWSLVVPALLFAVALGATVLLYRRFAGGDEEG